MSEVLTTRMEREIIEHALGIRVVGGKKTKGGYRNYFIAGGADIDICRELVAKGLMIEGRSSPIAPDPCFAVTDAGKKEVQP